jgi:hypothetical protein
VPAFARTRVRRSRVLANAATKPTRHHPPDHV